MTRAWSVLVGLVVLATACAPFSPGGPGSGVAVSLTGPETVAVGGDAELVVVTGPDVDRVEVLVIGGHGEVRLDIDVENGRAGVRVGRPLTARSGRLTFVVAGPNGPLMHDLVVAPGGAEGALDLFVGPRTVVGSSSEVTMAVGIVTDAGGNPVADGTTARFSIGTGATDLREEVRRVEGGLAFVLVDPAGSEGRVTIALDSGDATSTTGIVQLQAGPATAPALTVDRTGILVADGRALIPVSSELVVDAAGTALEDGSAARIVASGPSGAAVIPATIRGGRLDAALPAPTTPGTVELRAVIGDRVGPPTLVVFEPAVASFDYVVRAGSSGESTLEIGPVRDIAGGLVLDGTEAIVDGTSVGLRNGRATMPLAAGVAVASVQVLGIEGTAR